jgi:branched-chain amino acid aminotransferase
MLTEPATSARHTAHGKYVFRARISREIANVSEQSEKQIWVDGVLVDESVGGTVPLLTHTLHYGVGVFEGLRAYRRADGVPTLFRLDDHVERLFNSCRLVMMQPTVDFDAVKQGCRAVLRENGLVDGYVRPIVLMGAGAMGLLPSNNPITTIITAWQWGAYLGADGLSQGIRCKVSSFARHHVNVSFAQAKLTGQYINSVMAKREVTLAGYDEAILLDVNGFVAEGSGENIFIVKKGRLITPPTSSSILPGITRDTVMVLAREAGFDVVEQRFARDELLLADEVFLTGTAAEVTPVREIDDRIIGQGSVGPITAQLQARYFDVVRGSDNSHPDWLTVV